MVVLLVLLIASACGRARRDSAPETTSPSVEAPVLGCDGDDIVGGTTTTCSVPGWSGRDFDLHVPDGYDPELEWPVVVAYHGGGGTREAGARTHCPDGDRSDPGCLHALGMQEGFFVVYPDGTAPGAGGRFRTWNAGGSGELTCVVGTACDRDVDDVDYTSDLLDVLESHYTVNDRAIVVGLSNGAAMAHRAGCDLSERVGVVVAAGGTNQQPGCVPDQPVSVLQIHGTADPCWPYEGGELGGCLGGTALISGVTETMNGWVEVQHCASPSESLLPDTADDGVTSEVMRWEGCDGGVVIELVTVVGGGHVWPMGYSVAPRVVGPMTTDYSGNDLMWEFAESVGY